LLKCENLNPTGAFKVRGGVNLLASLAPEVRARGVIAASTGNHGQSVAYAASLFNCPATIFMPEGANPVKVAATANFGAKIVEIGRDFDAARLAAEEYASRKSLRYIHSADEPLLIAGVATAALELLETAPDLDVLIVPVGAGSGLLGAGAVARAVNPAIRIVAVQAEGAPAIYRSWREGRRIATESITTFAEGLATREPFDITLTLMPRVIDDFVLVSDDELASAIRLLVETARQVAEGAGAATVAAAMARRSTLTGKTAGLILSGGNITRAQLSRILSGEPPR
jgi:threonine dehydratase